MGRTSRYLRGQPLTSERERGMGRTRRYQRAAAYFREGERNGQNQEIPQGSCLLQRGREEWAEPVDTTGQLLTSERERGMGRTSRYHRAAAYFREGERNGQNQ